MPAKLSNDKFTKYCVNLDLYGKPVSLTFQGKEKYKTTFGAMLTLLVSIFLIGFGTFRFL